MRVGIDAQPVAEVHQALVDHGDRYRRRLFTEHEVDACGGWAADPTHAAEGLAARFAAKEATLKALRVTDRIPGWTEIEVVRASGGWVTLTLTGVARALADEAELTAFEISLTHTAAIAIAIVVAS
ncbi:MAG: 4'-phosphopantetheinyl transferase superfamily protein [Lacisediminihabitans sp.]